MERSRESSGPRRRRRSQQGAAGRSRARRAVAVMLAIVLPALGCIGPQAGHRDGYASPTEPTPAVVTNVRGIVRDAVTRAPVPDATVTFEGTTAVTRSDGNYTLERIYMRAGNITASRTGYLPFTNALALNGGERQFDILLSPAPAGAP